MTKNIDKNTKKDNIIPSRYDGSDVYRDRTVFVVSLVVMVMLVCGLLYDKNKRQGPKPVIQRKTENVSDMVQNSRNNNKALIMNNIIGQRIK